jgi:hypothetical protein
MLEDSLKSFVSDRHEIVLYGFENFCDSSIRPRLETLFDVYKENSENCLAISWNRGIKQALKDRCDYVVVPNLDIILAQGSLDALVEYASGDDISVMWSGFATNRHDSVKPQETYEVSPKGSNNYDTYAYFMVNDKLFKKVGYFDEHYKPAYCEDVDMEWRIHLSGNRHMCVRQAEFIHFESVTLKLHSDPEWALQNLSGRVASDNHFVNKWGGMPRQQIFEHPFNDPRFDIKYCGDMELK